MLSFSNRSNQLKLKIALDVTHLVYLEQERKSDWETQHSLYEITERKQPIYLSIGEKLIQNWNELSLVQDPLSTCSAEQYVDKMWW